MRVLISGAGIAGPTLAYWLARHGMTPTLVEKAPTLRTGGYVIDFWGAGFDVASRMGLLPNLVRAGYAVREVTVVDRNGHKVAGFPAAAFARAAMAAAYILAGELHRAEGRPQHAFARYQQVFGPFVSTKQRAARRFAGAFAPRSRVSLLLRNRLFSLFSIGWIADLVARRGFSDRIALPDY
jgi:2-polyprenyl-6-methoxyphenol hydroxylase-like FAD-dependent oxidoreductase